MTAEDDYDELNVELSRVLSVITYPCGKDELLQQVREDGTGDEVLNRLDALPDRVYEGPDEAQMFAEDSQRYQSGD